MTQNNSKPVIVSADRWDKIHARQDEIHRDHSASCVTTD